MISLKKFRKAVFIVVYSETKKGREYVLLKRKHHWKGWEFPKGKAELFESKKRAALREAREETGLEVLKKSLHDYKIKGKYLYKKELKDRPGIVGQTYHLFSVEAKKGKVKVDGKEHKGFVWLDFDKALKKLTHSNQKKCLKIVEKHLNNKKSKD